MKQKEPVLAGFSEDQIMIIQPPLYFFNVFILPHIPTYSPIARMSISGRCGDQKYESPLWYTDRLGRKIPEMARFEL